MAPGAHTAAAGQPYPRRDIPSKRACKCPRHSVCTCYHFPAPCIKLWVERAGASHRMGIHEPMPCSFFLLAMHLPACACNVQHACTGACMPHTEHPVIFTWGRKPVRASTAGALVQTGTLLCGRHPCSHRSLAPRQASRPTRGFCAAAGTHSHTQILPGCMPGVISRGQGRRWRVHRPLLRETGQAWGRQVPLQAEHRGQHIHVGWHAVRMVSGRGCVEG